MKHPMERHPERIREDLSPSNVIPSPIKRHSERSEAESRNPYISPVPPKTLTGDGNALKSHM